MTYPPLTAAEMAETREALEHGTLPADTDPYVVMRRLVATVDARADVGEAEAEAPANGCAGV